MTSFKKHYQSIFKSFGYPLSKRTAMPSKALTAAEKRLRIRIPAAIRDYYLVAGRERRFNICHNRLLPPNQWTVDKQRLVFMEENQSVVLWGVSTRNPEANDPAISQAINDESLAWNPEHRRCSQFLAVMLHYNAVNNGLRFCGAASVPVSPNEQLVRDGWTFFGNVNSLMAYSRPRQVVCAMSPGDLPFMRNWSIYVGGKTKADLKGIAAELGVVLE